MKHDRWQLIVCEYALMTNRSRQIALLSHHVDMKSESIFISLQQKSPSTSPQEKRKYISRTTELTPGTKNVTLSLSINASSTSTPLSFSVASRTSRYGNALTMSCANTQLSGSELGDDVTTSSAHRRRKRRGQKSRMVPRVSQRWPVATADVVPLCPSKQRVACGPHTSHGTSARPVDESTDEDEDGEA